MKEDLCFEGPFEIVHDDDGHGYYIPVGKLSEFYQWVDDTDAYYDEPPEWAVRFEGDLQFYLKVS